MSLKFNRKKLLHHYGGGRIEEDSEYEVIEFTINNVNHQIAVKKGLSDEEILDEIKKYLYGYETEIINEKGEKVKVHVKGYYDFYPKTKKVG